MGPKKSEGKAQKSSREKNSALQIVARLDAEKKIQFSYVRIFLRIVSIKVPVTGIKHLVFKNPFFFSLKGKNTFNFS